MLQLRVLAVKQSRHNLSTGLETVVFRPCHWQRITGGGEKLGKNWKEWSDFNPNELNLTFGVPDYCANFYQNWVRIVTAEEKKEDRLTAEDRRPCLSVCLSQTDRQTHRKSDFIICPVLCNSNETDNNHVTAYIPQSVPVKEFWKSVNIWYGQKFAKFGDILIRNGINIPPAKLSSSAQRSTIDYFRNKQSDFMDFERYTNRCFIYSSFFR